MTIPQIIRIAKISQYLCVADIEKSYQYGGVDLKLPNLLYNIRKSIEYWYDLDSTDDTLVATGNYLLALCAPYSLTAENITGTGGSVSPILPATGYEYYEITDTISADSTTYTNQLLIGGLSLSFIILNNQILSYGNGDFTFNNVTGVITGISTTFIAGDKITIPFNRKL